MRTLKNRKGSALFMALLGIIILSGLALLMVKRGTFGMKDTTTFKNRQTAFQAAEAGLEHARKLLNDNANDTLNNPKATWDLVLTAYPQGTNYIDPQNPAPSAVPDAGIAVNNVSYTVGIADNDDGDGNLLIDGDGIIIVTSTGTAVGKSVTLTALMKNNASGPGGQEHYNAGNTGVAGI